ncbi:MAG: carboxypeptidase-like regulatory domain-containing protein [Gemmatimonadota bacterium]
MGAMRLALCGTALIAFTAAGAQTRVTVRGTAYDSVRALPIVNAFVSIAGRSAMTDTAGFFQIDSITPGPHTVALQHESLDSLGLSGVTVKSVVTDGRDTIRLGVPSFSSLWRVVCGRPAPALDSGVVFGSIRDVAAQQPVNGASVSASWLDLTVGAGGALAQKRWKLTATSDASGSYALCGLPVDVVTQVHAATDSAASGAIDQVVPTALRIQRRDLVVGTTGESPLAKGTISGVVTNEAGRPLAEARVAVTDVPEVRTDAEGRFTIRGVRSGTQQLEALSLGLLPGIVAVDVRPNAVADVLIALVKGHTLDTVKVNATSVRRNMIADIESRRKSGTGHYIDSTKVNQYPRLLSVFEEIPSTRTQNGAVYFTSNNPKGCLAYLWVDGMRITPNPRDVSFELSNIQALDIAQIEVYSHPGSVPIKFQGKLGQACGAVVIWTKRILP